MTSSHEAKPAHKILLGALLETERSAKCEETLAKALLKQNERVQKNLDGLKFEFFRNNIFCSLLRRVEQKFLNFDEVFMYDDVTFCDVILLILPFISQAIRFQIYVVIFFLISFSCSFEWYIDFLIILKKKILVTMVTKNADVSKFRGSQFWLS